MKKARPTRHIVANGSWGTVECAVRDNGSMPAWDFLTSAECRKYLPAILAFLNNIANQSPQDDVVTPKPLRKTRIFEVVKGQTRLFCYRRGNCWRLTHGILKKTQRTPPEEIARAEVIMSEDDIA